MEGRERRHLEARIRVLRDIQVLLDAAVLQMNQYGLLVSRLEQEPPGTNTSDAARGGHDDAAPTQQAAPQDEAQSEQPHVLTPEEETNLSDQERLRRRRLQRFMNGIEQN